MSTADHTDALTRRIEQLAAAALDEGDAAALAAVIAALRSEVGAVRVDVGSLRSETGGLRTELDGLEGRLVAAVDAGRRETTSLLRRFAGELDETVTAALDEAAQASSVTGSSLEDARSVLESRLAVLEDALDGLSERLEALARDGAVTTTASVQELTATVHDLDGRLTAQTAAYADDVVARLGELVETRLAASEQRMTELLHEARARAEEDRAAAERLADATGSRLAALAEVLDRSLGELRTTVVEQQEAVLALTGRFSDLGDQLAGRLSEVCSTVDASTSRLGSDLTERLDLLEATMGRFRVEWPTRTFEVVQGAKAVAEGVTREVRAQVELQLDRVRDELAGAIGRIDDARDGLDAQGGRLAEAAEVLASHLEQRDLEQRDLVLEAERAPGLPAELELIEGDTVVRGRAGRTPRTGTAGPPAGVAGKRPAQAPAGAAPVTPAPVKRPAGAPAAAGGRSGGDRSVDKTGDGTADRTGGRAGGAASSRTPASGRAGARKAGPARAGNDRRARLAAIPEVPGVDVALDLDPAEPQDPPQPVPPELVGMIPVATDRGPDSGPATRDSWAPAAPDASPPAAPDTAPDAAPDTAQVPAADAGSALFARRPAASTGESSPKDVPAAPADSAGADQPDRDEDDGVRRLFRRRPRR